MIAYCYPNSNLILFCHFIELMFSILSLPLFETNTITNYSVKDEDDLLGLNNDSNPDDDDTAFLRSPENG